MGAVAGDAQITGRRGTVLERLGRGERTGGRRDRRTHRGALRVGDRGARIAELGERGRARDGSGLAGGADELSAAEARRAGVHPRGRHRAGGRHAAARPRGQDRAVAQQGGGAVVDLRADAVELQGAVERGGGGGGNAVKAVRNASKDVSTRVGWPAWVVVDRCPTRALG